MNVHVLKDMKSLVEDLEQLQRIVRVLDGVRRIDENPERTLSRLLEERAAAVQLVSTIGFKHDDFDYFHKYSLRQCLEEMTNEAANRREQKLCEAAQEDSSTSRPDSP